MNAFVYISITNLKLHQLARLFRHALISHDRRAER
jgi:hypothetical protein